MCPPAKPLPLAEIDPCWDDKQLIWLLDKYTPGSHLPKNVLEDLNPYELPPSNLPEEVWYLVHSNEKKENAHGFWKAIGEPCKIFSNSMIAGWRTTLEYYEGQVPHGQITDWLMQEYGVTQKDLCGKDKTKDSRLLCRVFHCSGHSSESKMHRKNLETAVESKKINLPGSINPNNNITSNQDSRNESKAKCEYEVAELPKVPDRRTNFSPQVMSELEWESFLDGDYLELNDLDPESHSSSSQNSSCPSKLSDEYFDSFALLREIQQDENECIQQGKQSKQSSSSYSFSTSVRSNDVVLQPPPSGSQLSDVKRIEMVEGSQAGSPIPKRLMDKTVQDQTAKRYGTDSRTGGTSHFYAAGTSSTGQKNTVPSGEKKAGPRRMKKLRTYFCFMTF